MSLILPSGWPGTQQQLDYADLLNQFASEISSYVSASLQLEVLRDSWTSCACCYLALDILCFPHILHCIGKNSVTASNTPVVWFVSTS